MKHGNIHISNISNNYGTAAPSAGANGYLGRFALESQLASINTSLNSISGDVGVISNNVAVISAGLDSRLDIIEADYITTTTFNTLIDSYTPLTTTAILSAAIDSINVVGGNFISVVESPNRTWAIEMTGSFGDATLRADVANITASLQSQIDLITGGGSADQISQIIALSGNSSSQATQISSISANAITFTTKDVYQPGWFPNAKVIDISANQNIFTGLNINNATVIGEVENTSVIYSLDGNILIGCNNFNVIGAPLSSLQIANGAAALSVIDDITGRAITSLLSLGNRTCGLTTDYDGVASLGPQASIVTIDKQYGFRSEAFISGYTCDITSSSDLFITYDSVTGQFIPSNRSLSDIDSLNANQAVQIAEISATGFGISSIISVQLSGSKTNYPLDSFSQNGTNSGNWLMSVIKSDNGAARTTSINGIWIGSTVNINETSTNDIIGSTSPVTFDISSNGTTVNLLTSISGSGVWNFKYKKTVI